MERCAQNPEKWKLYHYNEFLGYFDVVVIAHNGKCADKLMSTAGIKFSFPTYCNSICTKETLSNIYKCSDEMIP
jgi:hypothetical protein